MNDETTYPADSFVQGIDIHELLLQQEPMIMIDRLMHFGMERVLTRFTAREDNLFVCQGCLSPSGILENIAQTCAARIGYINKYILRKGIQPGVIGALRNAEIISLPRVGETVTTEVVIREEAFGMSLAEATVKCGENILATTEIKIAVKEEWQLS